MRRTLRGLVRGAAAPVLVAALAAPALAKAPTQVPTLEDVRARAEQADAEQKRKEREASRDPRKEAIDAYQDKSKKVDLKDYAPLVAILLDAKTAEVQDYRPMAAAALIRRFEMEDVEKDANVRQVRRQIALELADLLGTKKEDEKGLLAAEQIFYAWFPGQLRANHWIRGGKLGDRQNAEKKIRLFLKKSTTD